MSRWTTLRLILTLSLILLSLSAEVAAAADDLPRNIELKPGATLPDDATAADTSITGEKTRQIVTEPAAGRDSIPTDAAGKPDTPKEGEGVSVAAPAPAPQSRRRTTRQLRPTLHPPEAKSLKRPPSPHLRLDPLPSSSSLMSLRSRCRLSSSASAAIPAISMACGAGGRARRSRRSDISPRSMSLSFRQRPRSSL